MAETFQGPPCINGHDGRRYRSNGSCVTCTIEKARARFKVRQKAQREAAQRAKRLGAGRG